MTDWIRTKDRLPEPTTGYDYDLLLAIKLVYANEVDYRYAMGRLLKYDDGNLRWNFDADYLYLSDKEFHLVTHWVKIERPEDDDND